MLSLTVSVLLEQPCSKCDGPIKLVTSLFRTCSIHFGTSSANTTDVLQSFCKFVTTRGLSRNIFFVCRKCGVILMNFLALFSKDHGKGFGGRLSP